MSASDKNLCRNIVKAAKDWNSNVFKKDKLEENLINCRNEKNTPLRKSVHHCESSVVLSNVKESLKDIASVVEKDESKAKMKSKVSSIPTQNDFGPKLDSSLYLEVAKTGSGGSMKVNLLSFN